MTTLEHWTAKDNHGCTKIFLYVRRGWMNQIPREYLTKENMLIHQIDKQTPLHWAMCKHIALVPQELLTPENLLVEDWLGATPLSWACNQGNKNQLLGVEFPETKKLISLLGQEWFEENRKLLAEKNRLKTTANETNIELF